MTSCVFSLHSPCNGCLHYPRGLVTALLLAVLAGGCRAQGITGMAVNITIGSNNRSTAILPDETESIVIRADLDIMVTAPEPDYIMFKSCVDNVCTLEFEPFLGGGELRILLLNELTITQILILTIRENLNVSCAEYNIPVNYTEGTDAYVFTCDPLMELEQNRTVAVRWRKFRFRNAVMAFLENGMSESEDTIASNSTGIFTISNKGRTLTVNHSMSGNRAASNVAFYYVPSFLLEGSEKEMVTAETVIFLGPKIMDEVPEFSSEVIYNSGAASNFSDFRCDTDTFPPAQVTWFLISEEHPCNKEQCGVNVASFDNFGFGNSGTSESLTRSLGAIVHMLGVRYDQDGNFTCVADNGQSSVSRSFILRVKSPLRPLWPALGIIGVILLVSLFMLISFTVERVVERKKLQGCRSPSASPNHSDQELRSSVSSSGGQSNSRGRNHSAVKRLSSNKPLIDESTL